MFPIPTFLYKYIGLALIAVGIFGAGYYKGFSGEHNKYITFQAQVTQAVQDQNVATKKKDAENDAQTLAVANAYSDYANRLNAALERLRNSNRNNGSKLPPTTKSPQSPDGTSQELSGACKGSQFYANALEDAMKLQLWQDWAKRLNLEVQ